MGEWQLQTLRVGNSTSLQIHLILSNECISKHLPDVTLLMGVVSLELGGFLVHAKLQTCLSIPRIRTVYWVFNYLIYVLWTIAFLIVNKRLLYQQV